MTKEESAKLLDKAALICVSKHAGQRDKMGCAYFQHPMRVAMRCKTDEEKMVALLHDTIEDTDVTAEYLLDEGFPQDIVDGVLSVTKREGESYEDFVARAKQNPLGRVVKLHDLEDNLDVFRLNALSPEMAARFTKYLAAHRFLLEDEHISEQPEPVEHVEPKIQAEKSKPKRGIKQKIAESDRKIINKNLEKIISNKNTLKNEYTLSVKMADGSIICNKHAIDTFTHVLNSIGFELIASLNLLVDGQYPIVSQTRKSSYYTEVNKGWSVLSNFSNVKKAYYLNVVCDMLDLPIVADIALKPE